MRVAIFFAISSYSTTTTGTLSLVAAIVVWGGYAVKDTQNSCVRFLCYYRSGRPYCPKGFAETAAEGAEKSGESQVALRLVAPDAGVFWARPLALASSRTEAL